MPRRQFYKVFSPFLFILFLAGCYSYPEADVRKAKQVPNAIAATQNAISESEQAFAALSKTDEWEFLAPYSEREKLPSKFDEARQALAKSERDHAEVKKLLDNVDKKNEKKLKSLLTQIDVSNIEAKGIAEQPRKRLAFLLDMRATAPSKLQAAEGEVRRIDSLISGMYEKGMKAQSDYPQKDADIKGRMAGLQNRADLAKEAFATMGAQFALSEADRNYALFGDSDTVVSSELESLKNEVPKFRGRMDELYESYSKILTNMRVDYFVVVGRSSWDSWSDWDNSPDITYPPAQVDEATFTYIDGLNHSSLPDQGSLATLSRVNIEKKYWDALRINQKADWHRGDDRAVFWADNWYAKTYHQYTQVVDGVKTETDWQEVPEDYFWAHEADLGMAILSKPYGMYEEEAIKDATPPGMQYIATPRMDGERATGSNQYGEWRQDASGRSFWHYYGQYALMRDLMFSPNYYYSDYDGYRRRDRGVGYYGANGGYGTYGSRTYASGSRYQNANYVRNRPSIVREAGSARASGRAQAGSVRGAGAGNRGKGPGGRGK